MKVNKTTVLTVASAVFGVGSFIVNVLSMKDETERVAEEAAKIVIDKSKKENVE